MIDSHRVVLRVLAEEYEDSLDKGHAHPLGYGPYGRASERVGLPASKVGEIESEYINPAGMSNDQRRICILGVLDRGHG